MKIKQKGQILFLCVFFVGGYFSSHVAANVYDSHKPIVPPEGKTLLMVGQDQRTIEHYVKDLQVIPAGVMVYTSVARLEGLNFPVDLGAGILDLQYLLDTYPQSYLQVGLYMVGILDKINRGEYDENIDALARWIKKSQRGTYLRIGYEFDLKDNRYSPSPYVRAFKRIVDRFRALEVNNVAFVWHSGAYENTGDPMQWYPGDEYVDWFAVSFFGTSQYRKVKDFYNEALLRDKPFMLAETTPAGLYTQVGKRDWYKRFFYIINEMKPQAVCYINAHWDRQSMWKHMKWGDARIQANPEIKALWLEEINQDKYIHAKDLE